MLVPFGKYPSLSTNPQYTRDPTPRCDTEQADSCSQLHHETDNNSPPADTQSKPIHGNMYWLASNHTMVNNQTMVNKILSRVVEVQNPSCSRRVLTGALEQFVTLHPWRKYLPLHAVFSMRLR